MRHLHSTEPGLFTPDGDNSGKADQRRLWKLFAAVFFGWLALPALGSAIGYLHQQRERKMAMVQSSASPWSDSKGTY